MPSVSLSFFSSLLSVAVVLVTPIVNFMQALRRIQNTLGRVEDDIKWLHFVSNVSVAILLLATTTLVAVLFTIIYELPHS